MGMIDRYKKRGGFIQLLNLIETTGLEKREKFLKMIAEESPSWEATIKQKTLSIERMSTWNTSFLMEFMPQIPTMAVACAIFPLPEDKRAIFLSALPFGERKKVDDLLKEHKPNGGEIASSQIKIINEVRNLVATGKLKFEKFDPDLAIPEDIEEKLANGTIAVAIDTSSITGHSAAAGSHSATHVDLSAPTPAPAGSGNNEEANQLRKRVVTLTQEVTRLQRENKEISEKLEGIRAAIRKIA